MLGSGMPWPGDEGDQNVWALKWNERAYFSTRKVKLDHDYLSMTVLVQEIVNADYAFVIYTTNPSSGDSSEIYAEVVKGLGETLVGHVPMDEEDEVVLDYTTDPLITDQGSKNQSSRALHWLVMPLRISMGHHRAQDVEGAVKEGKL
uniref:Pyruvate phosphate dikinase AMP/ATP-binding domain-containing protein n=1 Tax=Oryza rufipogon TaxID=4529 RepID=A0A0E0PXX3_ORYRU